MHWCNRKTTIGDRLREHILTRTHPANQSLNTLMSITTLSSIWQFAASPYI